MTRSAIAIVLLAALAASAAAQEPPKPVSQPPGPGTSTPPVTIVPAAPVVIPIPVAKPPVGFFKSGPTLVGADGYYPFDTGDYLLGGTQGLARRTGSFYMVPVAEVGVAAPAADYYPVYPGRSHRLFHHRR